MKRFLGVDVGGTTIKAGITDENGNILHKCRCATRKNLSAYEMCGDIARLCGKTAAEAGVGLDEIESVGVGMPGVVSDGRFCTAENLMLADEDVKTPIKKLIGKQIYIENDGNAAAYGEYSRTGSKDHCFVMITLGTGVGGGIVIDGKIHGGSGGTAAETGHFVIVPKGRRCVCGKLGCFEAYCSASALAEETRKAIAAHPFGRLSRLCPDPSRADGKTAFDAARMGDGAAIRIIDEFTDYLSLGVGNIIVLLRPDTVCIGGGLSAQGDALIEPLRRKLEIMCKNEKGGLTAKICAASLGNDAGIVGAALLGRGV